MGRGSVVPEAHQKTTHRSSSNRGLPYVRARRLLAFAVAAIMAPPELFLLDLERVKKA